MAAGYAHSLAVADATPEVREIREADWQARRDLYRELRARYEATETHPATIKRRKSAALRVHEARQAGVVARAVVGLEGWRLRALVRELLGEVLDVEQLRLLERLVRRQRPLS